MTLLVGGILLGIAVPNFTEFQRNGAMTAAANQFVTGTLMARAEAIKRQKPVTLCLSDNPTDAMPTCQPAAVKDSTNRGFIVWVDESGPTGPNGAPLINGTDGNGVFDAGEQLLMQSEHPGSNIRVSMNCSYLGYWTNGFTRQIGGNCFPTVRAILFCDDRGNRPQYATGSTARIVRIDAPGRGQVVTDLSAITTMIGTGADQVDATCT